MLDRRGEKDHLICVNYDGFDGSDLVFPDILTVVEKNEQYIQEYFGGKLDGALGFSLGSTFVGRLIMRRKVHMDHGIFGSIHPRLIWGRTQTIGHGASYCDFKYTLLPEET